MPPEQPDPERAPLEPSISEFLEGLLRHPAPDSHIGTNIKHVYFAHLVAGDTTLTGQGAQDVTCPYFLLFAAVNQQGFHFRLVWRSI